MIDLRPERLPTRLPTVPPPPAFVDRRTRYRRTQDRDAHQEKVLLARALDVLASDIDAEARLAALLRLLARSLGAKRAAVVADGIERRAAVAIDPGEAPAEGEALAAWLDSNAPRSRARRAASGQAPISFVVGAGPAFDDGLVETVVRPVAAAARDASTAPPAPEADRAGGAPHGAHYASLPIPGAGDVVLGFEFGEAAAAEHLAERLPPGMARHAAVALALVTSQLAGEREVAVLRARDAEREAFLSTVAHELRTPLTGLRGYLELILGEQVDDPAVQREFLARSRSIVTSMGELVGDLLELARLESGMLELEVAPFSLAEAAGQAANSLLPLAMDRRIRLTTDLPPRLRMATGDRRRVGQVLTNLAANALKFTAEGGSVRIEARVDGLTGVFLIHDNGSGIPVEDRGRIFDRFHRMAGHERVTGTGLGLPIARDLARRMHGDLDVASVPGSGSTFVLVLPGPAEVPAGLVAATLARVLETETRSLEERLARRRFAAAEAADGEATEAADGELVDGEAGTADGGMATDQRRRPDRRSERAGPGRRTGSPAPA